MENENNLSALIKLLGPARALRADVEKGLQVEMYSGAGNFVTKSFESLQKMVLQYTNNPYVESLSLDVPDGASDKEKFSIVLFAIGQLIAYIEGHTGVGNAGYSGGGENNYNVRPLTIGNLSLANGDVDEVKKIKKMLSDEEE